MTPSGSQASASTTTVSSALPLTNIASTHSTATQSSSQSHTSNSSATTNSSQNPCSLSITVKARQWLWSRSRKAVSIVVSPVKKVFKSFEKTSSIFGLLLTLLFGPLGFVAVKIAIWQSLKDWYFYCLDQNKPEEVKVLTRAKCEKTLKEGLPPPPFSVFKRAVTSSVRHTALHLRSIADGQDNSSRGHSIITVYDQQVKSRLDMNIGIMIGTLIPLALFIFGISILAISLARRGWRRMRLRASPMSKTAAQRSANTLLLGIVLLLAAVSAVVWLAQFVAVEHGLAEKQFFYYCKTLSEEELSDACASAIKTAEERPLVYKQSKIQTFTSLVSATAIVIAIVAIVWIFTLAEVRLFKKLRRVVRARLGCALDPEDPQERVVRRRRIDGIYDSSTELDGHSTPTTEKLDSPPRTSRARGPPPKSQSDAEDMTKKEPACSALDFEPLTSPDTNEATLLFEQERRARRDSRNLVRKMAKDMAQLEEQDNEQALQWDSHDDDDDDDDESDWEDDVNDDDEEETWETKSEKGVRHRMSY